MSRSEQLLILLELIEAIIAVVVATPCGIPGGELYARMMAHGISLEQFERLMSLALEGGRIEKRGELYFRA